MLLIMTSSMFIALSLSIIMSPSPLSMGLWILLIALASSWLSSVIFNSWFAIIIFLIYIGGMLVMFAYFTALTPNQPLGMTTMWFSFLFAMVTTLLLMFYSNFSLPMLFSSPLTSIYPSISSLYYPKNSFLILLLASTLFFILVAVVKIALLSKGPLRPFK
uniref:NADH-ubiquinone oxidoreductase chain 6 n=1 Tax=Branchinotogluma japonicus TaxID=2153327 RepID=A0A343W632_9ANNE|nr:NADH dehydrogenase subunit 6 [Branchinotogluma japonicus]